MEIISNSTYCLPNITNKWLTVVSLPGSFCISQATIRATYISIAHVYKADKSFYKALHLFELYMHTKNHLVLMLYSLYPIFIYPIWFLWSFGKSYKVKVLYHILSSPSINDVASLFKIRVILTNESILRKGEFEKRK